jgi:hypothetical protein
VSEATVEALRAAINNAMGGAIYNHPGLFRCDCDGTIADHWAGHILDRIEEAGWELVQPAKLREAIERLPEANIQPFSQVERRAVLAILPGIRPGRPIEATT